ncbi:hypothetical protein IWW47_002390 [Coemansia sp. RSA 2052]|nr:hypothetical protein GGF38_005296 [Coemansia sp. RSA 25]KAJ2504721.1 hypothetical protein IWW47_002390 [Coemansia sp. RSA 2052]
MGKRKSSRKVVKKVQPKLDTTFDCVFCNHEQSIIVAMDRKNKVGNLKCKVCSATYQAALSHLSDPIDVYSEWIDACEEATRKETLRERASTATATATIGVGRRQGQQANAAAAAAAGSGANHRRPGTTGAASNSHDEEDDDDEDDEDDYGGGGGDRRRGYYNSGDAGKRDANGVAEQLTDESDMDDF